MMVEKKNFLYRKRPRTGPGSGVQLGAEWKETREKTETINSKQGLAQTRLKQTKVNLSTNIS